MFLILAVSLFNNIFAHTQGGAGVALEDSSRKLLGNNNWYANTGGDLKGDAEGISPMALTDAPGFVRYLVDGNCRNDDLRLKEGSPLLNRGMPNQGDARGRKNIGMH